jgi:uncharacterized protein YjhX (UPF0386 family)
MNNQRPLGDNQRHALKMLGRHRYYARDGEWVWVSHGATLYVLNALVRRDLVYFDPSDESYRLTSAGIAMTERLGYTLSAAP